MRKLTAVITALIMLLALSSCASKANEGTSGSTGGNANADGQSNTIDVSGKSDISTDQEEAPAGENGIDLAQASSAQRRADALLLAPNDFIAGLTKDGTVRVAIGSQYAADVSYATGWTNIREISAGSGYIIGLTTDGKAIVSDSLAASKPEISKWSDLVHVNAGSGYIVGVKSDGTVVLEKYLNAYNECSVSGWKDIIQAVSNKSGGTSTFIVGLKKDGTVKFDGKIRTNNYSETVDIDVSDWDHIIAISAGTAHFVGLKDDGTVVSAGYDTKGECNVSDWENIIAVAAGPCTTLGLKSDGTVVAVGDNIYHQCDVSDWSDIVAISAGYRISAGLKSDGSIVWYGQTDGHSFAVKFDLSDWNDIAVP